MAVGKVVKFDEVRGFGFIAPMGGSEDVFLHVNDLLIPESLVRPGATLEFDIDEGERGLKASNIGLPEQDPLPKQLARVAAAAPTRPAMATPPATVTEPVVSGSSAAEADGDQFCDPLTADEFIRKVTESLLGIIPALTGEQILNIRSRMAEFAKDSGWLVT